MIVVITSKHVIIMQSSRKYINCHVENYYPSGIDVSATVEASPDCFHIPCLSCPHYSVALQELHVIDRGTHEVIRLNHIGNNVRTG